MKPTHLMIPLISVVVLAAGCNREESASDQIDQLQADTRETAREVKDYPYEQKDEFTEAMRNQLAEINREIEQLAARIESSSDAVKAEASPKLEALREQAAALGRQIDKAGDATESSWESVKSGTNKAYDSLKDGFQASRQWVSDKIAP
jgi:phage host-nuclease inhibitor protein Gam